MNLKRLVKEYVGVKLAYRGLDNTSRESKET